MTPGRHLMASHQKFNVRGAESHINCYDSYPVIT